MESIGLLYVRGKISTQEYWAKTLADISFSEQCSGYPAGQVQLRNALTNGFMRLDQLDRSDVFWKNSNKLATLTKLHEFASYQIQQGRELVESAWLAIAVSLHHYSEHLIPEWWGILRDSDQFDAKCLVITAWSSSAYWGDESIVQLSNLARRLEIQMAIENPLHELARVGGLQEQWSNAVLSKINAI